ncbi:MAG TPA: hypothetical protein VHD81_00120 [Mycobacteriales bacterium]|nr:hypothetical protein [Mycobacteriales bacterium]
MIKRRAGCSALAICLSASGLGAAGTIGAAAATPSRPSSLTSHQVDRIVRMTGYHGLRSHRFHIIDTFRVGGADTVVVRLDHARLGVTRHELRRQLAQAAGLSAGRPTFGTRIRLHGSRERVTFHVAPVNALTPHASYLRYLMFTPLHERLGRLTRPEQVPDIQALTVVDAAHRLNVTLLQDRAKGATWGSHIPAARLFAMVESLNTSSSVFLSSRTIERLSRQHVDTNKVLAFGREIWSNSLGFAILAARTGKSYATYSRQATHMRFAFYRRYDLRYLKVPARQYKHFAHS